MCRKMQTFLTSILLQNIKKLKVAFENFGKKSHNVEKISKTKPFELSSNEKVSKTDSQKCHTLQAPDSAL